MKPNAPQITPQDEWEKRLLEAATDCGVTLSHEAVSSEGVYESDEWNEQDLEDLTASSLQYAAELYPEKEDLI